MNTKSSNKTWIWIALIIIIAAFGYFYFYGGSSTSQSSLTATPDANALIGAQVLGLLNQIKSLKIDTKIFADPGYKTLRDYSVVIPQVNVGRPNPFAPLSGLRTGVTTSASASSSANRTY